MNELPLGTSEVTDIAPSKYLIVSRIGKRSLHPNWLHNGRNFDVIFSSYDAKLEKPSGDGVFFEYRPGFKVTGYDGFLKDRKEFWSQYEYICLMDEDLLADTDTLNRMFTLCSEHNLKLSQPALTQDSHFTFAGLLQQPHWLLRHVNFVEMMCPIFRRDVLEIAAPLYSLGYESGIDLIWCNLNFESPRDFAVLDSCAIRHTEPVGKKKDENGFTGDHTYEQDIYSCLNRFNLPWLSCVPYEAIDFDGRRTTSRIKLFIKALSLLPAITAERPVLLRIKPVLDHLRHILTRPARNIRINWPKG